MKKYRVRKRLDDTILLVLRMKEGAPGQRTTAALQKHIVP